MADSPVALDTLQKALDNVNSMKFDSQRLLEPERRAETTEV